MQTRRNVLAGLGATLAVGAGATQVFGADSTAGVEITDVKDEEEYIVLKNVDEKAYDVSNWVVAFEYRNKDYDQRRAIPAGTTLESGETLTIATGAKDVDSADVTFDYDSSVINNTEPDVIVLLDTDGAVRGQYRVVNAEETSTATTTTESETTTTAEQETSSTTKEETTTTEDDGKAGHSCPDVELEAVGTTDPDTDNYATFRLTNHSDRDLTFGWTNVRMTAGQGTVTVAAQSEKTSEVPLNTPGVAKVRLWLPDSENDDCLPTATNERVDDC
jgi:hypothetical protein